MLLTNKTKVLLTHIHTLLTKGEKLTQEGKGKSVFETEEQQEYVRDCGFKIIEYCEVNGCTKDFLGKYSIKFPTMFIQLKEMYEICIKEYDTHICGVGSNHVPIIYAVIILHELKTTKLIGLELDYPKLKDMLQFSSVLIDGKQQSKFNKDKTIDVNTYMRKYDHCCTEVLKKVLSYKSKKKRRK